MNHCSRCGGPLRTSVPPDDDRERRVCDACGHIAYVNPRLIVGTLPVRDGRILLCRRAIEPRLGTWTVPSGFMECGETAEEGALRETLEETGAEAEIVRLFSVFSVVTVDQVYLFYLARVTREAIPPGKETSEIAWFPLDAIPWSELAFRSVEFTLRRYVEDPESAAVHLGSWRPHPESPWILEDGS